MFQINKLLSQKILFVISNTIQILGTHLVPLLVNCCSQSGPKNKTKILTVYLGTEGPRANLCGPTEHLKNLKIKKENIQYKVIKWQLYVTPKKFPDKGVSKNHLYLSR